MRKPPLPFPRSYWVEPGKFLAGYNPGPRRDKPTCEEKLTNLMDCGIRSFVNLMEEGEVYLPHPFRKRYPVEGYEETAHAIATQRGIEIRTARFGIEDVEVPTVQQAITTLDYIDGEIAADRPVFLHCQGGIGRTGVIVGCWLIRHNIATPATALHAIHILRQNINDGYGYARLSPETREQEQFVSKWMRGM